MGDQDATFATQKWYLGGRWRSEAAVKNDAGELDSRAVQGELDSKAVQGELDSRAVLVVSGPPAELDAEERRREV